MAYTVLARRYRSRDFDELVGQDAVADTLKRAVEQDRVAHAYLFCGTRGVGKTSMARILARALNAIEALADCDAVGDAIMRGDDLDVIEIDGASNRGVEQARELIAAAGLSPARSPYRIYIIDEVHMLTSEAFNTLLKTMEEPPLHVKFILCTTEPHKVPATIRSRCQRFDFKPIAMVDIRDHLHAVLKQEGVTVEDGVLERVAVLGNGSMRDALSVLERLLATGESNIEMAQVEATLGLPPAQLVLDVVDAVLGGDPAGALRGAEALVQQGISLDQVIEALVEMFRMLMLLAACGTETTLLELPQQQRQSMAQRAALGGPDVFAHAVAVFEAVARQAAMAASARALFDAALVRLAMAANLEDDASGTPAAGAKKKMKSAPAAEQPVDSKRPRTQSPTEQAPAQATVKATVKATATVAATAGPPAEASEQWLLEQWASVVEAITTPSGQAAASLLEPVSYIDGVLTVRGQGPNAIVAERIGVVRAGAVGVFGADVRVQLQESIPPAQLARPAKDADDDPLVKMVCEVFDAEVVQVRASKES